MATAKPSRTAKPSARAAAAKATPKAASKATPRATGKPAVKGVKTAAPASATGVGKQAQMRADSRAQRLLDKQFQHGALVSQMREARAAGYAAGGS